MPGTFSEVYPEEYEYFRHVLTLSLLSGSQKAEDVPVIRRALDGLANRRVARRCNCGAMGCVTFGFEHDGEWQGRGPIDILGPLDAPGATSNVLFFFDSDGEMTELEQYPLGE